MMRLLLVFFALLTICSCGDLIAPDGKSDPDGKWVPMKWKKHDYQVVVEDNIKYCYVPAEGGTYIFHCTNYSGFWLSDTWYEVDGKESHSYEDPDYVRDWHHYSNEWLDVKAKDGGILEVVFQPNTGSMRKVGITVTAGDIFDTFYFMQSRGK